jgi:polyhydroxyalkanoate synthesis regulator phasin
MTELGLSEDELYKFAAAGRAPVQKVRIACVALGKLATAEAAAVLDRLLEHTEEEVQRAALRARLSIQRRVQEEIERKRSAWVEQLKTIVGTDSAEELARQITGLMSVINPESGAVNYG